jgi:ribosomal protein L10
VLGAGTRCPGPFSLREAYVHAVAAIETRAESTSQRAGAVISPESEASRIVQEPLDRGLQLAQVA